MKYGGYAVILANGAFPRRGGLAWRVLESARRVVACDAAANAFRRRFGHWPEVVIGDFDSVRLKKKVPLLSAGGKAAEFVRIADQGTNDLSKAIDFCGKRGWRRLVILGATGKREDHAIGNVFRALEAQLPMVTDAGEFIPLCGTLSLRVAPGAAISVFAPDPATVMTSVGLEWPLKGVKFDSLYCATLNRAVSSRIEITSSRKAYVYLANGN